MPINEGMYSPEGPSARYNAEFATGRYLSASTDGWQQIEAPFHDAWAHQSQEVMMALFESARKRQQIQLPLEPSSTRWPT